jgi:transcriptional regulator with XRE-family HTH domain
MRQRWDGREIVSLRVQLGLTQAELAARLGVDQASISRWERGVRSPEPRARLQLSALLRNTKLSSQLTRETALVDHSPFPMSIITRDWELIALSPLLRSEIAGGNGASFQGRNPTTADTEYADSVLQAAGFFEGKVGAVQIIARGYIFGEQPKLFASLCTPLIVQGDICRLYQYEFLSEDEFTRRRELDGVVKIIDPTE